MPSPLDQPESSTPSTIPPTNHAQPKTTDNNTKPLAIEYDPSKSAAKEQPVQTLDLGGGQVVKLDALGPMIINSDGTLSRIQNWQDLHPIEQERTVRLLVKKRNLVRLQKLDQAGEGEQGEEKLSASKSQEGKDEAT